MSRVKRRSGGRWVDSALSFKRRSGSRWDRSTIRRRTNGRWEIISQVNRTQDFWATWTKTYNQNNTPGGGNLMFEGIDHRNDPNGQINVGDRAIIKWSATHYETGEWMDNWVHGVAVKIIQIRNRGRGRACLASINRVYSWIYEWDLQKIMGSNPYGIQKSLMGFDRGHIQSVLRGKEIKRVQLYMKNTYTDQGNGSMVRFGHHNHTSQPGRFSAEYNRDNWQLRWERNRGKWVDVPIRQIQLILEGKSSGISLWGETTDRQFSAWFIGAGNGESPRLRVDYIDYG